MFYKMITNARNRWLMSDQCTVKDLFAYIETAGQMRDAQTDAIKTYLFLTFSKLPAIVSRWLICSAWESSIPWSWMKSH